MKNSWKKFTKQFESLNGWYAQLNEKSLGHALIDEFKNKQLEIEILLTDNLTIDDGKSVSQLPSMNEMVITYQLNRCEAIKKQMKGKLNPPDKKAVDRILYPSLYIAYLQHFIRLIMILKKSLNLS